MNKIKTNLILLFLVVTLTASILFIPKVRALNCSSTTLTPEEITTCNAEEKAKLEKQAKTYNSIIKLKEKQEATISSQLQLIDLAQRKTTQELTSTSEKLNSLKDQISDLAEKIKENEKQLLFKTKILGNLMQNYYEYDRQGILDLVLMEKSISASLQGTEYIKQSGMKINELLADIRKAKKEMEEQKIQLEGKEKESEKIKETLEDKNLTLQNNENQKEILLGQTQKEKEKYSQLLASIENEIYELEANKSVDYSKVPAAKGGYFDYPVSSSVITQNYGCLQDSFARRSYPSCNNGKGGFHNGLDFGKNSGSSIFAARSGKVIGSGNNGRYAYGQWLAIDHGDGLVTLYGHLSSKAVSKGKSVKTGQKIGVMGNTGYSTGTHLHFSVFDKKSFEVVESKHVSGLMIPTGGSMSPKRYLK